MVQYVEGGAQYIAVHAADGYGEATEHMPHTLAKTMTGEDFSVYRIPFYLVSIPAVTRDARDFGLESLKPIYRAIGRLLYEAANRLPVRPPFVTVNDLALEPRTGTLFYIPPLPFSAHEISHKHAYVPEMNASIVWTFGSILLKGTIQALQAEVVLGADVSAET